jgi:CDP-paratose 2-epimerase
MCVFITGGLGFIGSNLTDRLLGAGRDLVVFDNASRVGALHNLDWLRSRHGKKLRYVQGDTRDFAVVQEAMRGAEIVFHLAAQVAVTSSVANPREDFEINALGTLNVLEAARRMDPNPAVLLTSTNKVYGGMEHLRIVEAESRYAMPEYPHGIPETFPLDFHSPYGCSKGAADQYVRDYFRIYGLPTVVFRMSCIYGTRQFGTEDQGWVAHFVMTAKRRGPLTIYGNGKQVRDVLYVDDLLDAMLAATSRLDVTAGQVYNIGGGPANSVSVWAELSRLLAEAIQPLPPVNFGGWRPGDQRVYISDIRRAAEHLHWQPRVSPREGIKRLALWAEEALAILGRSA